jgi:transcriptional regulator of acetoin/glycerol metabolism
MLTNAEMTFDLSYREAKQHWMQRFERDYVEEMLRRARNNISLAARLAGLNRGYFYRLLWKHGLRTHSAGAAARRQNDPGP